MIITFSFYVVSGDNHDSPSNGVIYFNTTSSFFDLMDLVKGRNGRDGRDGRDGKDGEKGPQGERGERGAVGPRGAIGPAGPSAGGAVYTRWGKNTCPSVAGTKFVYKGVVGKSHYNSPGGGMNYLCLPDDPEYLSTQAGVQQNRGYVFGTEYEMWDNGPLKNVHLNGVPCSVCLAHTRGAVVMIPGKISCPMDWTREYYGYLMSERHAHKSSSTFECVDKDPDSVPGSSGQTHGGIFMHVESRCGTHLCPPYTDGNELTCVVCSI